MIKDIHFHGSVLMSQDHVNMLARSSLWFMEILELIHSSGFLSRPSFMVCFIHIIFPSDLFCRAQSYWVSWEEEVSVSISCAYFILGLSQTGQC